MAGWEGTLFDREVHRAEAERPRCQAKEVTSLDRLKNLEEKIAAAVDRVKALKDEKTVLEKRIKDLEQLLDNKNEEIASLQAEKVSIKGQIDELLEELETIEL